MSSVAALLLFSFLLTVYGEKLSLNYCYTMQSTNSHSNIYDCTAVTLLNDRQIDFYNSTVTNQTAKTPQPDWLKISQSDWIKSTERSDDDRQWLNKLINIQMDVARSDGHVLQLNLSCEGEQHADVITSINEFGYDGEDLIQFNCSSKTWLTPEEKKNEKMEQTWNEDHQENAVRKCEQCEVMLKMYLQYRTTDLTPSHSPPAVYVFAQKSVRDSSKLNLTCLATRFYPKDVVISLRKFTTSIPEHLVTSSGVRPNDDGTYQLRKSVEIPKDDPADYYCYVNHRTLTEPVIKQWDGRCTNCSNNSLQGVFIGVGVTVLVVVILSLIVWILKKKGIISDQSSAGSGSNENISMGNLDGYVFRTGDQSSAGSGSNENISMGGQNTFQPVPTSYTQDEASNGSEASEDSSSKLLGLNF